jgi:hypothetical protein
MQLLLVEVVQVALVAAAAVLVALLMVGCQ